jgi:pyruvate-formate lyase-activating enzyme
MADILGIREPDPRTKLSLDELAMVQSAAAKHITFSLTLACPLQCAHCIVDAGPGKGYTTMKIEVAQAYAAQMPELYTHGIRAISFTGGEPLLARQQLRIISTAAAESGIDCGVVTASHWAANALTARKVVESLPGIHIWDLSIDKYHEEFVSFEKVRTAYEAVKEMGKQATLRFTYHEPLTADDRRILKFISGFADGADCCSQRVRSVGRGKNLKLVESQKYHPWMKPCLTQGMVVRYDGSVAPCCVSLIEERRHPFQLGDARERPLAEIHSEYMSLPLLQMLRTIGFLEVVRWIEESDLASELKTPLPDDVCDLCPRLLTNASIAEYLSRRAATPANRLRIAILASRLLGEHEMLQRTVRELKNESQEIEGFALAAALVGEIEQGAATDPVST